MKQPFPFTLSPEAIAEIDNTLLHGAQETLSKDMQPSDIYKEHWVSFGMFVNHIRNFTASCGEGAEDRKPHGDMVYIEHGLTLGAAACKAAFATLNSDEAELWSDYEENLRTCLGALASINDWHNQRLSPIETLASSGWHMSSYIDRIGYVPLCEPQIDSYDERSPIRLTRTGFAYSLAIGASLLATRQIFFIDDAPLAEVELLEALGRSINWGQITPEDIAGDIL